MKAKMQQGKNVALLPGGFQEATLYSYGKHRVYIKTRKVKPATFVPNLWFSTASPP
jgi:hypothetical protein